MMHGQKKSDSSVVAVKSANKPAQAGAESMERRGEAKGNAEELRMRRTQGRESVFRRLDRVRQRARHKKKERFTALLHHVDIDLLLHSFYGLKRGLTARPTILTPVSNGGKNGHDAPESAVTMRGICISKTFKSFNLFFRSPQCECNCAKEAC